MGFRPWTFTPGREFPPGKRRPRKTITARGSTGL